MPGSIPPITFPDEPPYAVYSTVSQYEHVDRLYDFEVALRIFREKRGFAIRNETYASDGENQFGGLRPYQVDAIFAAGWPWTGVSQVGL